jgi:hypothetical protein
MIFKPRSKLYVHDTVDPSLTIPVHHEYNETALPSIDTVRGKRGGKECFFCKNTGHFKRDCPKLKKALKVFQQEQAGGASEGAPSATAVVGDDDDAADGLGFVSIGSEVVAAANHKLI